MADYPTKITERLVRTGQREPPASADRNASNREIEAIETAIGINPTTIVDTTVPSTNPASLAVLLDMLANIVKTFTGAANWYSSAVPIRKMLIGGNLGGVIAASGTLVLSLNLNGAPANIIPLMAYAGSMVDLYFRITTAQPASGSLVISLLYNTVNVGIIMTIPAGSAAGVYSAAVLVPFRPGDSLQLSIVNNAAANSAGIGTYAAEIDQTG